MNALPSDLNLVISKFISHQSIIEDLYKTDTDFKTLCADLLLCAKTIRDYEDNILDKQRVLIEYQGILNELEQELLVLIEAEIKAGTSLHKIP